MKIGHIRIGYRKWDSEKWKDYIIPKAYIDKEFGHNYYQYYHRWLNFVICKPRKCECCGKRMTAEGVAIWDTTGTRKLITICRTCKDTKIYTDTTGETTIGYRAWLHQMWDIDAGFCV